MSNNSDDNLRRLFEQAGIADIGNRLELPPSTLAKTADAWLSQCPWCTPIEAWDATSDGRVKQDNEAFVALFWHAVSCHRLLAVETTAQELVESTLLGESARASLSQRLGRAQEFRKRIHDDRDVLVDCAWHLGERECVFAVATVSIMRASATAAGFSPKASTESYNQALRNIVHHAITSGNQYSNTLPCAEPIWQALQMPKRHADTLERLFLQEAHDRPVCLPSDYDSKNMTEELRRVATGEETLKDPAVIQLAAAITEHGLDWPAFLRQPSTLYLRMMERCFSRTSEVVARTICCYSFGASEGPGEERDALLRFLSLEWAYRTSSILDEWFQAWSMKVTPDLWPESGVEEQLQQFAYLWEKAKRHWGEPALWNAAEPALQHLWEASAVAGNLLTLAGIEESPIAPQVYFSEQRAEARQRQG